MSSNPKYQINQTLYFNTKGKYNKVIISAIRMNSYEGPEEIALSTNIKTQPNPFRPRGWEYEVWRVRQDSTLAQFGSCEEEELLSREEFITQYGKDPELAYTPSKEVTPQK